MLSRVNTVLFDLDGTLTVPVIDFDGLRKRLGLPDGQSITHALNELPIAERERGFGIVREAELDAAYRAQAAPGAIELVRWLQAASYAVGIVTRNFQQAVDITLHALQLEVPVVITRDCAPPKPAPDAIHEALARLGRTVDVTLMVGDYTDDILAGQAAGTLTCLVTNGHEPICEADLIVQQLPALQALLAGRA